MAVDSVRAHKFRSFLTVLGIVIGVMTAITIASILTGLRQNIIAIVEEYGTNNIYAFHLTTGGTTDDNRAERFRKPLTVDDAEAIRTQADAVEHVGVVAPNIGYASGPAGNNITANGHTYKRADIEGVSANYADIINVSLAEGRFISDEDDQQHRNVIVIGVNIAAALFPDGNKIIDTDVKLGGETFVVIGVLEKRQASLFGENQEDNVIFIPLRTAQKKIPGDKIYLMLVIRSYTGQLDMALGQSEEILRRRRQVGFDEPNNFDIKSAGKLIEHFDGITAMIGLLAISISSLGLLVGGIGVMNIMLVSVTERTREIGIRKAIGARRRDIVNQFLFEAMTLTFMGGVLGVILAVGISHLIMLFVPSLPASIPLWAVVTGLSVSIVVGLVFGVWPASKAARLDPIECLRYE